MSLWSKAFLSLPFLLFPAMGYAENRSICPDLNSDFVRSIHVFDGPPEDRAYLMASRRQDGTDIFSVRSILSEGRPVFIQCHYASGRSMDVRVNEEANVCMARHNGFRQVSVVCN